MGQHAAKRRQNCARLAEQHSWPICPSQVGYSRTVFSCTQPIGVEPSYDYSSWWLYPPVAATQISVFDSRSYAF